MNRFDWIAQVSSVALLIVVAVLAFVALRRASALRWAAAGVGAGTFVLAAPMLQPAVLHATGVTAAIHDPGVPAVARLLAMAATAALFEEVCRRLSLGWLHRWRAHDGAAVCSFAVGYAIAELVLVGVIAHVQLLLLALQPDGGAALMHALPDTARQALQRQLSALGLASAVWIVVERLAACVFQVAFTLLVARSVAQRSLRWFAVALVLHFVMDLPAAAYQVGLVSLGPVEVAYAMAAMLAVRPVLRGWRALGRDAAQKKRQPQSA